MCYHSLLTIYLIATLFHFPTNLKLPVSIMTTHAILQIPRTTSSATTTGPSLLNTFPPEIRNAIYRLLFKRKDPVLIRNREHVVSKASELRGDRTNVARQLREYRALCDAESKADAEFDHGFQDVIFLRTCRHSHNDTMAPHVDNPKTKSSPADPDAP
jgi:hypothetical protein